METSNGSKPLSRQVRTSSKKVSTGHSISTVSRRSHLKKISQSTFTNYDARDKNPDEFDEDNRMSPLRLNNGSKVLVEYTPTTWSGKKAKNGEVPFGNGCTLKLQSIFLLEDKYNFQSPRKRRRMR